MQARNHSKSLVIIIVLIAIAVFGVYYFIASKDKVASFRMAREEARELYLAGKKSEVISVLENEVKNAPSKDSEASAKYVLAGAYVEVDYRKGIALMKEIAADVSYPSIWRARAVTSMANLFILNSRANNDSTKAIFSGDPYLSFAGPAGTSTILGTRRLYEHASRIYVMPYTEYRIAEWYIKRAIISKLYGAKLDNPLDFYISNAKEHIKKGEEVSSSNPNNIEIGYGDWTKGMVLGILWELEKKDNYLKAAEDAFAKSFVELADTPNAPESYRTSHEVWARFSYASFLYRAYGNKRAEDIKKLTGFIVEKKGILWDEKSKRYFGLMAYLERIGKIDKASQGQSRYDYENALALAKINPDFANFLKDLGGGVKTK